MIKKLFSLDYNDILVQSVAKNTLLTAVSSNIVTVILVLFIFRDTLCYASLFSFASVNLAILALRDYYSRRYLNQTCSKRVYLKIVLFVLAISALSYQWIFTLGILNGTDDMLLLTYIFVIISLTAGSMIITSPVYLLFVVYLSLSLSIIVVDLLYLKGETYTLLAVMISIFYVIYLKVAYGYYRVARNSSSLEKTFETLFDKSPHGIVLVKNHRFVDCNESIMKMFDYENKKVFLSTLVTGLSPKYQPDGSLSIRKMLLMMVQTTRDKINNFEWVHKRRDGTSFWTNVVLMKVYLDGEEFIYGTWRDISARKTLEIKQEHLLDEISKSNDSLLHRVKTEVEKNRKKDQQLLEQSRLAQMGEMINMIAHQWRQPLTAISATTVAMELKMNLGVTDKEKTLENIRNISNYSQHLSETIDDFRNFFKTDNKKNRTTYKKIIENVLNIVEISIQNKNIEIIKKYNSDDIFDTFENELRQVVLNIIKNAEDILIDKKIDNARITIETDANVLTIKDNAGGIPEDIIGRIFDPYFSTKLNKNGTGLGLYMSKTIIEDHCNGKMSVQNDENGAVFKISLTPEQVLES